jgi:hypothetical protein
MHLWRLRSSVAGWLQVTDPEMLAVWLSPSPKTSEAGKLMVQFSLKLKAWQSGSGGGGGCWCKSWSAKAKGPRKDECIPVHNDRNIDILPFFPFVTSKFGINWMVPAHIEGGSSPHSPFRYACQSQDSGNTFTDTRKIKLCQVSWSSQVDTLN